MNQILKEITTVKKEINLKNVKQFTITLGILIVLTIILNFIVSTPQKDKRPIVIFFFVMNFGAVLFFHSNLVGSKKYNRDFRHILPQRFIKTFASWIDIGEKQKKTEAQPFNVVLMHSLIENKLTGIMGIMLSATALHIKGNYNDFLRKLYEIEQNIPITIQISLAPSKLAYTVFISKSIRPLSQTNLGELLIKLRHMYHDLLNCLQINFAHFQFSNLTDADLVKALQFPYEAEYELRPVTTSIQVMAIIRIGLVMGNIALLVALFITLAPVFMYIVLGLYLGVLIRVFKTINDSNISSYLSQDALWEIDLFTQFQFLYHARTKKLFGINLTTQRLQIAQNFVLESLNQFFRFNQNKFYRELVYQIANSSYRFNMKLNLNRVIPANFLEYHHDFAPAAWAQLSTSSYYQDVFSRTVNGFWTFQHSIEVMKFVALSPNIALSPATLQFTIKDLHDKFGAIISTGFPYCNLITVPDTTPVILLNRFKSRNISRFGSKLPQHFNTGERFHIFIEIPDEIHKALPANYPAEFSTPLLNDEIILGSTINTENNKEEAQGGINMEEVSAGVMFAGQEQEINHYNQLSLAIELHKRETPMIIFDWDGSWVHFLDHFKDTADYDRIKYFQVGGNLGLRLFDLPNSPRGPIFMNYLTSTISLMEVIFQLPQSEASLLRTVWSEIAEKGAVNATLDASSLAKGMEDSLGEKYKNRLDSVNIYSQLLLLRKDYLNKAFNIDFTTFLNPKLVLSSRNCILIDLSKFRDTFYKQLFIMLFLNQLRHLIIEIKREKNLVNLDHVVFLPRLHLLFSRSNKIDKVFSELITELIAQKFAFVCESFHLSDVSPAIVPLLVKNYFITKTTDYQELKILQSVLNLDKMFTNIYTKSQRKVSYQIEYIKTMAKENCIVMRTLKKFPFIFKFENNYTCSKSLNYNQFADLNDLLLNANALINSNNNSCSEDRTVIENDFESNKEILPKIIYFLRTAQNMTGSPMPLYQIEQDLAQSITEHFSKDGMSSVQIIEKARGIIQTIIKLGYLVPETNKINKIDIEGYQITEKLTRELKVYDDLQQLKREKAQEKEDLINSQHEAIINKTEIIQLNHTDQNEKRTAFKNTLPDLIVDARLSFEQQNIDGTLEILNTGIERLIPLIAGDPEESQLKMILNQLKQLQNQSKIPLVLMDLEEIFCKI